MTTDVTRPPLEAAVIRHAQTMRDLLQCFRAWEPDARVLGNVRAEDAAAAVEYCLRDLGLEDVAAWHQPPCQECGAMTQEEAETKCHCGGDKDDCHGCQLWPD